MKPQLPPEMAALADSNESTQTSNIGILKNFSKLFVIVPHVNNATKAKRTSVNSSLQLNSGPVSAKIHKYVNTIEMSKEIKKKIIKIAHRRENMYISYVLVRV